MKQFKVTFTERNHKSMTDKKHSWMCSENEVPGMKRALNRLGMWDARFTQYVEPGQPKPKSKAQIKREKDAFDSMVNRIRYKLEDFHNLYLEQSYNYEVRMLENQIKAKVKQCKKYLEEPGANRVTMQSLQNQLDRLKVTKARDAQLRMKSYNQAEKSYQDKFAKLISKLVEYGFTPRCKVVSVASEDPRELSFLVQEHGREVHARVILAWGPIIRPHYRFITTERAIRHTEEA